MPHKVWQVGEEVLAADFNTYVQNQTVVVFPNTAARDTWLSPPDGAVCQAPAGVWWNRVGGAWARMVTYSGAISHTVMPTLGGTVVAGIDDVSEWLGMTIPLPTWATTVYVTTSLHHIQSTTADNRWKLRLRVGTGGPIGVDIRFAPGTSAGTNTALTWTDRLTLAPGNDGRFSILCARLFATGQLSANENSSLRFLCQFQP